MPAFDPRDLPKIVFSVFDAVWAIIRMTILPILNSSDDAASRTMQTAAIAAWFACSAIASAALSLFPGGSDGPGLGVSIFGIVSLVYILVSALVFGGLRLVFGTPDRPDRIAVVDADGVVAKPGPATIVFGFNLMATGLFALALVCSYVLRLGAARGPQISLTALAAVAVTAAIVWLRSASSKSKFDILILALLCIDSFVYLEFVLKLF